MIYIQELLQATILFLCQSLESIGIISEPLTHIINLSIRSGIVPDRIKIACVIPIFKSGDSLLLTNYRPVSVLPVFSKLLEKVVYNRILKYLDKHCIFKNQYGFRKGLSTSFALLHLFVFDTVTVPCRGNIP